MYLLHGVILTEFTLCDLITSERAFACLSINIVVYLYHDVGMEACNISVALWLILLFVYYITMTSVILSELIIYELI